MLKPVQKAYKYRIYPTPKQKEYLELCFKANRLAYNQFLEWSKNEFALWQQGELEEKPSPLHSSKDVTTWKNRPENLWMYETPATSLFYTLRNYTAAWKNTFRKLKEGETAFPKFKSRFARQSFKVKGRETRIVGNRIFLPKMREGVKIVCDRLPTGRFVTTTVSKNPDGRYYVSIGCETSIETKPKTQEEIGIDLGIKDFIVLSDGTRFPNPRFLKEKEVQLKRLQRRVSKKKKGSINRNKARLKLAKKHAEIARAREYFQHQVSNYLINNFGLIVTEDLSAKNMMKNHHLAKAIGDVSWNSFIQKLTYKAEWYDRDILKINRFAPSSKLCYNCGYKNDSLTLKDRHWTCPECGERLDRDVNAARNILKIGLGGGSTRQQPVEPTQTV